MDSECQDNWLNQ